MARGDIFRKPFFRKLMHSINMLPIYRLKDGYASRNRNDEVFEYCVGLLRDRRVIAIYVEGEHHLEKRVLPAKKGLAYIAFAALEDGVEDLEIVPAGCNYQYGDRARDEVMVNMGAPIRIADYKERYADNRDAAIDQLCNDIEVSLKKVCLHIEKQDDYALTEQMLTLVRSIRPDAVLPTVVYNHGRFAVEKQVCDRVNSLTDAEKESLKVRTDLYFNRLQQAGLDDMGLLNPGHAHWKWILVLLTGFFPFLAGYVGSFPSRWFTRWLAAKKVSDVAYYGSVVMGVRHLGSMIYFGLLIIAGLCTLRPLWIGLTLLLPLLDWLSLVYLELWTRWRNAWRAGRYPQKNELLQMRAAILETFPVA
jgi:hypothetical protein